MIEFALLAPIFFMILLGVLDLGRAGFYFVVGSALARDGARFAAVYNNGTGYSNAAVAGLSQARDAMEATRVAGATRESRESVAGVEDVGCRG